MFTVLEFYGHKVELTRKRGESVIFEKEIDSLLNDIKWDSNVTYNKCNKYNVPFTYEVLYFEDLCITFLKSVFQHLSIRYCNKNNGTKIKIIDKALGEEYNLIDLINLTNMCGKEAEKDSEYSKSMIIDNFKVYVAQRSNSCDGTYSIRLQRI